MDTDTAWWSDILYFLFSTKESRLNNSNLKNYYRKLKGQKLPISKFQISWHTLCLKEEIKEMPYTTINIMFIITYIKTYVYVHKKEYTHRSPTFSQTNVQLHQDHISTCIVWYIHHMHKNKESCHRYYSKTKCKWCCPILAVKC